MDPLGPFTRYHLLTKLIIKALKKIEKEAYEKDLITILATNPGDWHLHRMPKERRLRRSLQLTGQRSLVTTTKGDHMNFEEKMTNRLTSRGLFPKEARQIITLAKETKILKPMKHRWQENIDEYPTQMREVLWLSIETVALEWIKEHLPKAYFRSLFE